MIYAMIARLIGYAFTGAASEEVIEKIASVINRLEDKIREGVPIVKLIYIEPDVFRED